MNKNKKEIQLTVNIEENDLIRKAKRTTKFKEKGLRSTSSSGSSEAESPAGPAMPSWS